MRRETTSWAVVGGLLVAAAAQQTLGCGPTDTGPAATLDPRIEALLAGIGPEVVLPALERFVTEARALREATAALAASPGPDERAAAQAAFLDAMEVWQEVEVMQVGPAASSLSDAAGLDLRDAIYAWPSTNRCRVDQETATAAWTDPAYFASAAVNVIGLDALEVVLFTPGTENGCPAHTEPNASGAWDALGDDGVAAARAGHADALAEHLVEVAEALHAAWDPAEGDFGGDLPSTPGAYTTQRGALNAVFNALFYLETRTKDRKLGIPLGIQNCPTDACVDGVETRLAGSSHRWVAANLAGFRALFTGADGAGMDDLLDALGHGDVAAAILDALDASDAAAATLDEPIDVAALGEREPALALYDAIKGVTDVLKGDLATVLTLQIPQEAAGDND